MDTQTSQQENSILTDVASTRDGVSVILPVYQAASVLEGALRSVLAQTYRPIELLLVDDGSTDGSADLCDRFVEEITGSSEECTSGRTSGRAEELSSGVSVRVFHTPNHGVSHARNVGLDHATMPYIAFLDADDRMEPEMLSTLVSAIANRKEGERILFSSCDYRTFSSDSELFTANRGKPAATPEMNSDTANCTKPITTAGTDDNTANCGKPIAAPENNNNTANCTKLSAEEFLEKGLLQRDTHVWGKVFVREEIQNLRFTENCTIGEDMLFLLYAISMQHVVTILPDKLYDYYSNPQGAMEGPYSDRYFDQITCWESCESYMKEHFPDLYGRKEIRRRLRAIECTSAMLVAGKLSKAPREKWNELYQVLIERLRKYLEEPGTFRTLELGYRVKTALFLHAPILYLKTYHLWKLGRRKDS